VRKDNILSAGSVTFFIEILNIFHMFQISYRLDHGNNLSFQRIKIENNRLKNKSIVC